MRGNRRLSRVAPHLGKDGGLRVCIDYPGLNRAVSQEHLWPSHVGRCEGPPHSYIRIPFGLPNAAAAHHRLMEHPGSSGGQAPRVPGGDGDGP